VQIFNKIIWDMETMEVIASESCEYFGPVESLCGATGAQKRAAAQEQSIASLLTSNFQKVFGDNELVLKNITDSLTPIVERGPSQYGLSPQEDAALRTKATAENAAKAQQVTNSVRSAMAARGGGNTYMPTGSEAAIEGQLAEEQAQKQADTQLGITEKGYDVGRQNFFGAEGALQSAPGALEAPITNAGNSADSAAGLSMQGATEIADANNAWIAPVAGMIGSLGSGALGGLGRKKPTGPQI
jgi:hypothetical protein